MVGLEDIDLQADLRYPVRPELVGWSEAAWCCSTFIR